MKRLLQTHQDHAEMFEDILTGLAASDAKLGADFTAHLLGYSSSIEAAKEEMRRYQLVTPEISGLVPKEISIIFAADDPYLFGMTTVKKLGYLANKQFALGTLGDHPRCKVQHFKFHQSGSVQADDMVVFQLMDNMWMPVDPRHTKVSGTKRVSGFSNRGEKWSEFELVQSKLGPMPEMAAVAEWAKRMCWGIRLSALGAPGVVAATDPTGVRELLRMRDVAFGKSRREALLHWVKEHWRQNRKDPTVEHQVREHLRGSDRCQWFGLECRIIPSSPDAAKNTMENQQTWRQRAGNGRFKNIIVNGTRIG